MQSQRQRTGIARLDEALGGGLLPGTLTVVIGASGVGKSQLGISWANAGKVGEERRGAIIDFSSRGDPQNHAEYARRVGDWEISPQSMSRVDPTELFSGDPSPPDCFPFFGYGGKRVLRSQLDVDQWDAWQSQLNQQTPVLTEFVYRNLVHGTRRFLLDGIEPQERASDSLQLEMVELLYHRMIRVEHDWLARELFRQNYRALESQVMSHAYDHTFASAMALLTTRENLLDQLIEKPLEEGDLAAGANTIILMGKIRRENGKYARAFYIAKHRGSYCDDSICDFSITDRGIQ